MSSRLFRSVAGLGALVAVLGLVAIATVVSRSNESAPDQSTASPIITVDPDNIFDPVAAGETLPPGYRVGLARDQIKPVYNPAFLSPTEVDWPDDMLVIGFAGPETAKAYPVTHLNSREMVIDSVDGIPILVTW